MSCYNCTKKFGFLCSEKGCPDCGFAFCSGCLKHKVAEGKSTRSVCGSCHRKRQAAAAGTVAGAGRAPPDALVKRLSALENPSVPHPITVYTGQNDNSRMGRLKRGLSKEDTIIADRLEKLKNDRKSSTEIPSELEMAERLAALKGAPASRTSTAADERVLKGVKTDTRSDVERTDDLVAAITAEAAIDSRRQRPEDEVAERLARLKGEEYVPPARKASNDIDPSHFLSSQGSTSTDPVERANNMQDLCNVISKISVEAERDAKEAFDGYSQDTEMKEAVAKAGKATASGGHDTEMKSDSEDEEEEEARLVEQILAEARLDDLGDLSEDEAVLSPAAAKTGLTKAVRGAVKATAEDDDEELPWCAICNEDANWRCQGCEGDLYCQTCLKECHDEFEIKDHKFAPYKKKKST